MQGQQGVDYGKDDEPNGLGKTFHLDMLEKPVVFRESRSDDPQIFLPFYYCNSFRRRERRKRYES